MIMGSLGLEDNQFLVGTEGGMVQKCLIQKPQDKDIRHFLTMNANVTWSEEAIGFLANISD